MKTFKPESGEVLLSRLDKVHRLSDGRYQACCPVHDDRNPSMTVTILPDKVLTYCHSQQCSHGDILKAVNMDFQDFYETDHDAAQRSGIAHPVKLKPVSESDLNLQIIRIAKQYRAKGKELSLEDISRLELALQRVRQQ